MNNKFKNFLLEFLMLVILVIKKMKDMLVKLSNNIIKYKHLKKKLRIMNYKRIN